ncbi:MAG: hypothetical protein U0165_10735 [Polyangiaceae bacterium]
MRSLRRWGAQAFAERELTADRGWAIRVLSIETQKVSGDKGGRVRFRSTVALTSPSRSFPSKTTLEGEAASVDLLGQALSDRIASWISSLADTQLIRTPPDDLANTRAGAASLPMVGDASKTPEPNTSKKTIAMPAVMVLERGSADGEWLTRLFVESETGLLIRKEVDRATAALPAGEWLLARVSVEGAQLDDKAYEHVALALSSRYDVARLDDARRVHFFGVRKANNNTGFGVPSR